MNYSGLSKDFNLPKENQTNLIMEIDNGISFFVIHSSDIQPKPYILYPPRDYSLINIFKRKYSMFYNIARHYIYLLCDNRGFKPTEETLEHLLYLLISKWKNLTKHLFNHYNRIDIKVYSHISLQHAENIADLLISDLPQAVKVSVIEEPILNEEILSAYDFDLLISTETLMLNIEQPIIYMYRSRHSYQHDYLHKMIKEIALKKEQQAGVKDNLKF